MAVLPRYPVYVPSKGRWTSPYTIRTLVRDQVPCRLVVEPSEEDEYREMLAQRDTDGLVEVLVMPRDGMKLLGARNWIRDHAEQQNVGRHWQLDDNIKRFERFDNGRRPRCNAGPALAAVEDFSDRYENVGVAGMNYHMFGIPTSTTMAAPFKKNVHVYSNTLVNHEMPCRWRLVYNDDVDLCLQALAAGWCTIAFNAFLCDKQTTMLMKGGNTDDLYQGDGRLKMARTLERVWPGVVKTSRRYGRPQHVVDWNKFRHVQLRRRTDIDWQAFEGVNNYGLTRIKKKRRTKNGRAEA